MRVSRIQAAENRQTVINVASRLFREHGFDGIGLKDLMKGAGLTQGAFYKQFASKEDLVAQASRQALESATRRWSAAVAEHPKDPLGAVIAFYLSTGHREEKMDGCPIVALGSDAARQGREVKASFEAGIKAHLEILGRVIADTGRRGAQAQGDGHTLDDGRCGDPVARHQRSQSSSGISGCGSPTGSRSRRRSKGRPASASPEIKQTVITIVVAGRGAVTRLDADLETQSSIKREASSMNKTNLGVALVTGASSGIGHATAKALRNAGFRVFGTSRRAAAERSDGVTMLSCDVTDDASVAKLVDEVLAEAGRIDVLVNNAGIGLLGGAEESSTAQAQALFDVNVFGARARQNSTTAATIK